MKSIRKMLTLFMSWLHVILFFVALYFVLCSYNDIQKYYNLVAVQWCKKVDDFVYVNNPTYGMYIYTESIDDSHVSVQGVIYEYRISEYGQPYKFYKTDMLANNIEKNIAMNEWSTLSCKDDGNVEIGKSRYIFKHMFVD